jgi:hypothetical protein
MNTTEVVKPAAGAAVDSATALSGLLGEVLGTSTVSRIIGTMAPEVIARWAGKNPFKKAIARVLGSIVAGGFVKNAASKDARDLPDLLGDPEFAKRLGKELPAVMEGARDAVISLANGIERLAPGEKCSFLGGLLAAPAENPAAGLLTLLARIVNDVHAHNPRYFAETMRPAFVAFLERTDFGELKELIDRSAPDIVEFVRMANSELWEYPAKTICILGMLPSLVNIAADSVRESLAPINGLAPDLLADVMLALVHDIDGPKFGAVINELSELVRKVHTGSTLIGEQGKPQFTVEVSRLISGAMGAVDVNLLLKARALLAEIRELTLVTLISLLGRNPVLAREFFQGHFTALVRSMRNWSHKADAFETLFTDDEIAEEFARGMREIDAQQLADTVSRIAALFNKVRKRTPGIIRTTLTQVMNSLDAGEIGETARWLTNDVVRSIKPVASEVLPPVIRGVAELLSPDQYDDPGELEDALAGLRKTLLGKEVAI